MRVVKKGWASVVNRMVHRRHVLSLRVDMPCPHMIILLTLTTYPQFFLIGAILLLDIIRKQAETKSKMNWTPLGDVPKRNGFFSQGTKVTGIPYSSVEELDKVCLLPSLKESAEMLKPIWREDNLTFKEIQAHPDTNLPLGGIVVSKWQQVKDLIMRVSAYLPWTPYLVTDIIPTETGVKILEINSHGQACNCEAHYPFCLN